MFMHLKLEKQLMSPLICVLTRYRLQDVWYTNYIVVCVYVMVGLQYFTFSHSTGATLGKIDEQCLV